MVGLGGLGQLGLTINLALLSVTTWAFSSG